MTALFVVFVAFMFSLFCVFIFEGGKIPADEVINKTEIYIAPKQQTIITLVLSCFGMLFSLGCLLVNILYRKHRYVFVFHRLSSLRGGDGLKIRLNT